MGHMNRRLSALLLSLRSAVFSSVSILVSFPDAGRPFRANSAFGVLACCRTLQLELPGDGPLIGASAASESYLYGRGNVLVARVAF